MMVDVAALLTVIVTPTEDSMHQVRLKLRSYYIDLGPLANRVVIIRLQSRPTRMPLRHCTF